jgi:hypothetical protein
MAGFKGEKLYRYTNSMFVEGDNSTSGIAVTGKMFMGAHIACNMLPQCDGRGKLHCLVCAAMAGLVKKLTITCDVICNCPIKTLFLI